METKSLLEVRAREWMFKERASSSDWGGEVKHGPLLVMKDGGGEPSRARMDKMSLGAPSTPANLHLESADIDDGREGFSRAFDRATSNGGS